MYSFLKLLSTESTPFVPCPLRRGVLPTSVFVLSYIISWSDFGKHTFRVVRGNSEKSEFCRTLFEIKPDRTRYNTANKPPNTGRESVADMLFTVWRCPVLKERYRLRFVVSSSGQRPLYAGVR